jgi:hypothetical protein
MTNEEQRGSLRQDLQNVIDRHLLECDMAKAEIIGVLELVKLRCWSELSDTYDFSFAPDEDLGEEE